MEGRLGNNLVMLVRAALILCLARFQTRTLANAVGNLYSGFQVLRHPNFQTSPYGESLQVFSWISLEYLRQNFRCSHCELLRFSQGELQIPNPNQTSAHSDGSSALVL